MDDNTAHAKPTKNIQRLPTKISATLAVNNARQAVSLMLEFFMRLVPSNN